MSCVLFIDGENFLHKIEEVLVKQSILKTKIEIAALGFEKLLRPCLKGIKVTKKVFYTSKIHFHPESKKKSIELINAQRKLRNNLVDSGYEFIIAGNVRAQIVDGKIIFREKGVDVKIAIDLVSLACDKKIKTAIICSSDSDLQPAVAELKKRKVEVIYLGFENSPNKGLTYTTDRTILLRNSEIIEIAKGILK